MVHIVSMAKARMSQSPNRHLQSSLEIRYIHGALRSGYATLRNAQCNNSEDILFLIRCIQFRIIQQTSFGVIGAEKVSQKWLNGGSEEC